MNKLRSKLTLYFRNYRIRTYEKIMIQNNQLYFLKQIKQHSISIEEYENCLCRLHLLSL